MARRVSERGVLPSVQAMGLAHTAGMETAEVACNLLDPGKVGSEEVQGMVERLAEEEGFEVGQGYFTGSSRCTTQIKIMLIKGDFLLQKFVLMLLLIYLA